MRLKETCAHAWGPEDVDILLHSDLADKTEAVRRQPHLMIDPVLGGNMPPVQVFEIKPTVRMPRRWQPWKFISVAMVIPWLLMHATQQPTLSKQVAPPMLRKASLPPVLHFVPMHEANWPKWREQFSKNMIWNSVLTVAVHSHVGQTMVVWFQLTWRWCKSPFVCWTVLVQSSVEMLQRGHWFSTWYSQLPKSWRNPKNLEISLGEGFCGSRGDAAFSFCLG